MAERQKTDTESDEYYVAHKCHEDRRKPVELYHDLGAKCCLNCNQPRYGIAESPELGRRRRRRSRNRLQHCPSCHCPPEALKYSIERANYTKNMDAVLNEYEDFLTDPTSQVFRKTESDPLSPPRMCRVSAFGRTPACHRDSRKRQPSSNRRQCRGEQEQAFPILRNALHSGMNADGNICYQCPRSMKSGCKRECCWRGEQNPNEINENESGEPRREDDDWSRAKGKLRFSLKQMMEDVEDHGKREIKQRSDCLSNILPILKASTKSRNVEDLPDKRKFLTIDTRDGNLSKEADQRDSSCERDKESTSNREEAREDPFCELTVNDVEQETSFGKSVYAAGDLNVDLHAIKSHILDLIDRVLNKKLAATSSDQQKNAESNRGSTEEGIYIEITRALQSDWCEPLAEDSPSHGDSRTDYIKHLKYMRWNYMKHIKNELIKLCNLQKFLDNYSPRQSLPAFQSRSAAVEQRPEEWQQQQHEEKQNLGTIS
ncbi:uncharacterized protein LOC143429649 [Xylocopa sonorina]|uniref:uncharacterized protein LOC143429649 n=1 Tax=Xylocopa sonorina TaxID=1818115 RepID=UPI00403AFA19